MNKKGLWLEGISRSFIVSHLNHFTVCMVSTMVFTFAVRFFAVGGDNPAGELAYPPVQAIPALHQAGQLTDPVL